MVQTFHEERLVFFGEFLSLDWNVVGASGVFLSEGNKWVIRVIIIVAIVIVINYGNELWYYE